MLRRVLVIVACIAAVGWSVAYDAAGQPALKDHRVMVSEHTTIREIGSVLNRAFHPVRIISAHVPDSLIVGESGLFTAQVNVESASLPITGAWEFSDGTLMSGLSVRHAFEQPGRYEVRFRAANRGSDASEAFEVEVLPNQ